MSDNNTDTAPPESFEAFRRRLVWPTEKYDITAQQTVFLKPGGKGGPEVIRIPLCANALGITALARDAESNNWAARVEWLTPDGKHNVWLMPTRVLVGNGKELAAQLAEKGVLFSSAEPRGILQYLLDCQVMPAMPHERTVPHLGFSTALGESMPSFVLPDRVIRPPLPSGETPSSERLVFGPRVRRPSHRGYRQAGTLEAWRANLAPFGDHPLIVFGTLCGLAGPFLKLTGEDNFGVNLWGDSSHGKSTALMACASVMGLPDKPQNTTETLFQSWNTTANGVELLLAPHSGMTVTLDDVGSNDAGFNVYNLFAGVSKARMTDIGQMQDQSTWTVLIFSTAEKSVQAHVQQADVGEASAGGAVRMLDLDINSVLSAAVDLGGPELPDPEVLGPAIKELGQQLTRTHGTALPAFVEKMLAFSAAEGVGLDVFVKEEMDLAREHLLDGATERLGALLPIQQRGVGRLALIAAIGLLAADEVLPFTEAQVLRAVEAVRDAWLRTSNFQSLDTRICHQVREHVIRYIHMCRFPEARVNPPAKGWPFFFVPASQAIFFTTGLLQAAAPGFELNSIEAALKRAGWLQIEHGHIKVKASAALKPYIKESRAYKLLARQVLGEAFDAAVNGRALGPGGVHDDVMSTAPGPDRPAYLEPDEDGVLDIPVYDSWRDRPATEDEIIATMPREPRDPFDVPTGPTLVMPKRQPVVIGSAQPAAGSGKLGKPRL